MRFEIQRYCFRHLTIVLGNVTQPVTCASSDGSNLNLELKLMSNSTVIVKHFNFES